MASAQAVARKEEVAINELIGKVKEGKPQDEMVFGGRLNNKSSSNMSMFLHEDHVWSGNFHLKYPEELKKSADFVQTEKTENGIKTAVLYSLKTGETPFNHYGYLLAWSDSYIEGKHTRKVYGTCGLMHKFHNIDWAKVEKDLDASGSTVLHFDPLTRTTVKADIAAYVVYAEFS